MTAPLTLYAVCPPGIESLLAAECGDLGLAPGRTEPGGVAFQGDLAALYRANLELRTAVRVLLRLGDPFEARFFDDLVRQARRLAWKRVIPPGATLRFRVTSRKSRLYHEDGIAERLLAAVAAQVPGVRPAAKATEPDAESDQSGGQLVVVRVVYDRVTVSADSSGAPLFRRGYRLAGARAPLRENVAAAMLRVVGWDGRTSLVDPFAGAGTIPIEAALLARRIAPGLGREFAFERWPGLDGDAWTRLKDEARGRVLPRAGVPIRGFDRDAGAVAAAQANAERAGVSEDIVFERRTVSALPELRGGALVTNPPWGARVGDRQALRDLYARLGQRVRERCPESGVAVLVARREHESALGLALTLGFRTVSGGIPVRCLVRARPGEAPLAGRRSCAARRRRLADRSRRRPRR